MFDKFTPGTVAAVAKTYADRHTQVLQHLQSGPVFVRLRTQSANVVLRGSGTKKMFHAAGRFGRLGRRRRLVFQMEKFRKVSVEKKCNRLDRRDYQNQNVGKNRKKSTF